MKKFKIRLPEKWITLCKR